MSGLRQMENLMWKAPLVNIEKTNWVKKGSAFLKAKFEKKKI